MSGFLALPGDVGRSIAGYLTSFTSHVANLSDAQLRRYGQCTLAAAACLYAASSFQAAVPPDAKYAVDAFLPQGYDRSVIAARLEHRHAKQVLLDYLAIQSVREALRTETTREGKLRGWKQVFERTLVGLLAGAYTHSLTLSLFTMKDTVRVLVFVLQRRDDAEREKKGKKGPLGKVKTWWSGGTRSLIMESLMERVSAQMDRQASPFANTGLVEEPVPLAPGQRARPGAFGNAGAGMRDGRDAFVYSQLVAREISAAAQNEDEWEDDLDNEGSDTERGLLASGEDRVRNSSWVSNSSGAWTAAAIVDAERLFSVSAIMGEAIPRIVATATAVVQHVLARQQHDDPKRFHVAGSVTSRELRALLVELCEEMNRAACIVEWLHATSSAGGSAGMRSSPPSPRRGASVSSFATDDFPRAKSNHGDNEDGDDDVVRFPAGSTTILGPDGLPLPKSQQARRAAPGAGADDEAFMEEVFGLNTAQSSAEVRRARREAMKEELAAKQQLASLFQELIHSASFAELCLQYADRVLGKAMAASVDITGVKSYDAATDSAKVLMVIPSLEAHRQRALDTTDFEVQPSMRLFCEELVRSTCSNT